MEKILEVFNKNATKIYLILANLVLFIFGIWFSNVGLLPFSNAGDFAVFALLAMILALYRPSWTFAFFIGTLALENINLAPKNLGLAIRPYQFFGFLTLVALAFQMLARRISFSLPKCKWQDALPILFVIGGFLSAVVAPSKGLSLKQAIVATSFVVLYFLARVYIQSWEDLKRIAPFFLSSSVVVMLYGIWQNVRFLHGANAFEVMPGRPNATFTEPDWYGIYLVFLLSVAFAIDYFLSKKTKITNYKLQITNKFLITKCLNYLFLILIFTSLLLTVSRSAWVGAIILTIGFWKIILTNGSLYIHEWKWHKLGFGIIAVIITLGIAAGFATMLTRFQISNRAASTGGLQKITIACQANHPEVPNVINDVDELAKYDCEHINLEDIVSKKAQGYQISEIFRTDPTVNIRSQIYQKSIAEIKNHPVSGIGWGSISSILGTDERGAGLNASNIFLEVYLGSGLLGILAFAVLLGWILIKSSIMYLDRKIADKTMIAFVALGLFAILIPNLFNSGIFLGFLWVYLAVATSLLNTKETNK